MYIRKNIVKNYLFFFLIFFSRSFSFILLLYCSMASLTSISSFARISANAEIWKCWVNYISSVVETFLDAIEDPSFKVPTPTRQQMVDWVKETFDYLTRNQEMVKHALEVCGITVSDIYMKDVLESLGNEVEEEDDDPFTL